LIKALIRLLLILIVPATIAVVIFVILRRELLYPLDSAAPEPILVEVLPGLSFRQICKEIENKEVIKHWWSVELLARLSRSDTKIPAGEYELSRAMSPKEILKKLVQGRVYERRVLIKEGATIADFGKIIEEAGLLPAAEFQMAMRDERLLHMAGIGTFAKSFEGYLFPQTYLFSRPITPKDIIWRMLKEFEDHWPREYTLRSEQIGLSRHEALTLASIIEKESGNFEEQPIISSVFHNRLKQGMKLQSDPTVIYGIENFNGNLTKDDLQTPTPYNTYVNFGLPPGPICNPGASAIKAALYPSETAYYFFVGTGEGKHAFAENLQAHNENVRKFQLGRNRDAVVPPAVVAVPSVPPVAKP
jgi:UPF0755 protein